MIRSSDEEEELDNPLEFIIRNQVIKKKFIK